MCLTSLDSDAKEDAIHSDSRISDESSEVLGLYRKREGTKRLHEHGVVARFRYNGLKEAALTIDSGRITDNTEVVGQPSRVRLALGRRAKM